MQQYLKENIYAKAKPNEVLDYHTAIINVLARWHNCWYKDPGTDISPAWLQN